MFYKKMRVTICVAVVCGLVVGTQYIVLADKHIRNKPEDNVIQWHYTIAEGQALSHNIVACDPNGQFYEGNRLIITAEFMPDGMVLSNNYPICTDGACSSPDPVCDSNCIVYGADLEWTPTYRQAGTYLVLIRCTDASGNEDNKWLELIVTEEDIEPPFLAD